MPRGAVHIVQGYQALENHERRVITQTAEIHRDAVGLWLREITLYRLGILGSQDFRNIVDDPLRINVYRFQTQLVGLGLSTAKTTLDLLLAGYYSVAFSAIRHMVESVIQYLYVATNSEKVKLWYPEGLASKSEKTPPCREMVDSITKYGQPLLEFMKAPSDFPNTMYRSWKIMSKGSHPSAEGIHQLNDLTNSGRFLIGAVYNENYCLVGFDHGLFAIANLMRHMVFVKTQSDDWGADFGNLWVDISNWRQKKASQVSKSELLVDDDEITTHDN